MRLALLLALAALAAAQSPAPSAPNPRDLNGWTAITWGMTVAQARAALLHPGGPAALLHPDDPAAAPPGPNFRLHDRFAVDGLQLAGAPVTAAIQSAPGQDSISAVTLTVGALRDSSSDRAARYAEISRLLRERYGNPRDESSHATSPGIATRAILWILPRTSITLTWSESRTGNGALTVRYQAVDPHASDIL